jgi:hypothetical protein
MDTQTSHHQRYSGRRNRGQKRRRREQAALQVEGLRVSRMSHLTNRGVENGKATIRVLEAFNRTNCTASRDDSVKVEWGYDVKRGLEHKVRQKSYRESCIVSLCVNKLMKGHTLDAKVHHTRRDQRERRECRELQCTLRLQLIQAAQTVKDDELKFQAAHRSSRSHSIAHRHGSAPGAKENDANE